MFSFKLPKQWELVKRIIVPSCVVPRLSAQIYIDSGVAAGELSELDLISTRELELTSVFSRFRC